MPDRTGNKIQKGIQKRNKLTKNDTDTSITKSETVNLMVKEGHPGHGYAYLENNSHDKIPLISVPENFFMSTQGATAQLQQSDIRCRGKKREIRKNSPSPILSIPLSRRSTNKR